MKALANTNWEKNSKRKTYLKRRWGAQPQAATNPRGSSLAAIPLVHLQVCRELTISLSSSPMFSPLFISSSLHLFPLLSFISHGFLPLRLSRQSALHQKKNFIKLTLIYIYLNHFDQLELSTSVGALSQ